MFWQVMQKKCPFCGIGALVDARQHVVPKCLTCDHAILPDHGDLWFFLLMIDRALLIFPMVIALYFDWHKNHFVWFCVFIVLLTVVFSLTMHARNRLCLYFYLKIDEIFLKSKKEIK